MHWPEPRSGLWPVVLLAKKRSSSGSAFPDCLCFGLNLKLLPSGMTSDTRWAKQRQPPRRTPRQMCGPLRMRLHGLPCLPWPSVGCLKRASFSSRAGNSHNKTAPCSAFCLSLGGAEPSRRAPAGGAATGTRLARCGHLLPAFSLFTFSLIKGISCNSGRGEPTRTNSGSPVPITSSRCHVCWIPLVPSPPAKG